MEIFFKSFCNQNVFLPSKIISPLTSQFKRIQVIAFLAFACLAGGLAVYYVFKTCRSKGKYLNKQEPHVKEIKEKEEVITSEKEKVILSTKKSAYPLTSGKSKALKVYKANPHACTKMEKFIIFNDIKNIQGIEDLIIYLSDSSKINLHDKISAQVIIDILKQCDKETSVQLVEWLSKQETFQVNLLKESLQVLIEKEKQRFPVDLYAIEQLIKIYKEKSWNQIKDEHKVILLPSNHPILGSAMAILIKGDPNNNRIHALVEWMMHQKEYDLATFSKWIQLFQQKEQMHAKVAGTLYYPLLNKMVAHATEKWQRKEWNTLNKDILTYLQSKNLRLRS